MKKKISNKARLLHIKEFIEDLRSIFNEITLDDLLNDKVLLLSLERLIEKIGEATNHIDPQILEKYNGIDWRAVINMRNFIVHEYFQVDYSILYTIVKEQLDPLEDEIDLILENENFDN